jgi:hypothetical protein
LVVVLGGPVYPCTWAPGYFYQVTQLRGIVVGAEESSFLGIRWHGRPTARKQATLSLYEYRWPIKARSDMPLIKQTHTDAEGHFEFGLLQPGHYTLVIDEKNGNWSDWFDVEIVKQPKETDRVTINVTPP